MSVFPCCWNLIHMLMRWIPMEFYVLCCRYHPENPLPSPITASACLSLSHYLPFILYLVHFNLIRNCICFSIQFYLCWHTSAMPSGKAVRYDDSRLWAIKMSLRSAVTEGSFVSCCSSVAAFWLIWTQPQLFCNSNLFRHISEPLIVERAVARIVQFY